MTEIMFHVVWMLAGTIATVIFVPVIVYTIFRLIFFAWHKTKAEFEKKQPGRLP